MTTEKMLSLVKDGVGYITFNNPEKHNAVSIEMWDALEQILDGFRSSKDMKDPKKSNVATACYLIYITAMRVGDEKDPEEADTVGATTLRKSRNISKTNYCHD